MRSLLLVLVVLAAVGGLCWYLLGPESGRTQAVYDDSADEDGEEASGPGLIAAGSKRAAASGATTGAGWIQGTVTRADKATAGLVELRHVEELDPRNPYGTGIEMQMIARMLDSGVSTKSILMKMRTGDDGRFRFKGLAPGRYEVRATTDTGAMGFASASLPARGARVEASIKIPVGDATLKGRVVYADDKPFHGLVVASTGEAFAAMMGGGGDVRPTETDAEGRFSFSGLVPGKTSLSAIIPARMRVMGPPVTLPHAGEYLLTIDNAGNVVRGRVLSAADESPISGATVFGGGGNPAASFAIRSTTTDAEGRFRLPVPVGRGSGVLVQAEGYAPSQMEKLGTAEEELVVTLVALGRIAGRVAVKENGSPATGVTVFAQGGRSSGGMSVMSSMSSTVTDADGRYALENVAPGSVSVHALGSGWVSDGYGGQEEAGGSPYATDVEPGEAHELNIEVVPGAKVTGALRTSSGQPVVGAVVLAATQGNRNNFLSVMLGLAGSFGAVVTDEEGRFEIDVLAPGANYHVTAQAPDHPDATSDEFTAVAGKTQVVDLVMTVPRYLQVRVVAMEGGAPVPGATVLLRQKGGEDLVMGSLMGNQGPRTDTDGRTRLGPVRSGEIKLDVSAPGFVARRQVEVDDDGSDAPSVTVEVTPGLVVAGKVIAPAGAPVGSVSLTVTRNGGNGLKWFHERPAVSSEGSFRVDTIDGAGLCQVKGELTWKERTFQADLDVDAGTEEVRLELLEVEREAAGLLVVTVVDADGKAVSSGRIRLRQSSGRGNHSSSRRFGGGRVTFRDIAPDAELFVEVYELIGDRGAVLEGPLRPEAGKLEIRLPVGRTITGRALDAAGKGVRGLRISAQVLDPVTEGSRGQVHDEAVSDAEGNFTLKGLGDLEYELTFKAPLDFAPLPPQTLRAGTQGVSLSLRAGLAVTLKVVDFAGTPVPGAAAYASPGGARIRRFGGLSAWTRSDRDGLVRLRGLERDGSYNLQVRPPKSRGDLKPVRREEWHPSDETIQLGQAWEISGQVKDQKGRPAPHVWVRARAEGTEKWAHSANTNEKGEFSFQELDSGPYELRVNGPRGASTASPAISVGPSPSTPNPGTKPGAVIARAGAKDVALTVDIGERLTVRVAGMERTAGQPSNAILRTSGSQGTTTISGVWEGATQVVFKGLVPDTSYELWIVGLPGNAYVHKDVVETQEGVLEVTMKAGLVMAGHARLPAGMARKRITVIARSSDGFHVQVRSDLKTGKFKLEGLPPGTCTVHAYMWDDGKPVRGSVEASAGDTDVQIELKKKGD